MRTRHTVARRSYAATTLTLALVAGGCSTRYLEENPWEGPTPLTVNYRVERDKPEMGPPPPGYWKITADPVPGWTTNITTPAATPTPTDGPGVWQSIGPKPILGEYWSGNADASGRVVSIAPHPTNPNICYIASASGGIWKTTDGGANWSPLTDQLSLLTHGAIALDPANPNIIYAGTGEYSTQSGGDGIFKSTDAGLTWTRLATSGQVGANISKIVIAPGNSQVIHVTGTSGYYRSTDAGATWTLQLGAACSDLVINPLNANIVYIARANDGIYRSTDAGSTLTKLTTGLPTTSIRRIALAISRSNPSVLHAAFVNPSAGLLGHYRTTNAGDTWTQMVNTPNYPSPQGWYDLFVAIDPNNANAVYAGGVFPDYAPAGIVRSLDGGASWTDVTKGTTPASGTVHPDMHTIAFGPGNTIWAGSDGGVWKSTDNASTWTNLNNTLAITQLYQIALDPTNASTVVGGTQDNGTIARDSTDQWPQILAGDGGYTAFDPTNPNRLYSTYVYLTIYRLTTTTFDDITGPWSNDPRAFIAPLALDTANPNNLLGGTNRIWRNSNATTSTGTSGWTPISTTNITAGNGTVSAIAIAPTASNTIYSGADNGRLFVTTDATTWTDRSFAAPGALISDIIISPTNPAVAYASTVATSGPRLMRTTNLGQSWTSVASTLPAGVGIKSIEVDWRFNPPDLYAGTGSGIWISRDGGATWTRNGPDFPNVNVTDLRIDNATSTITAATYGRGAWRTSLRPLIPACYANCDNSTTPPTLNAGDFACFLTRFREASALQPAQQLTSYANCDNSTTPPILNAGDFGCFITRFRAGCP